MPLFPPIRPRGILFGLILLQAAGFAAEKDADSPITFEADGIHQTRNAPPLLGAPVAHPVWLVDAKSNLIFPESGAPTAKGWRWTAGSAWIELDFTERGKRLGLMLRGANRGIKSIGFKFRIDASASILVPGGRNGLSFKYGDIRKGEIFTWPRRWEAPLVVVEGEKNCLAVWSEDESNRYKTFALTTNQGEALLSFETEAFAPFDETDFIQSPVWYLELRQGTWQEAMEPYRRWMLARYTAGAKAPPPSKAASVQAMVLLPSLMDARQVGVNLGLTEALAGLLDPPKTLLWTVTWYDDESYRRKPDLPTPVPGYRELNEAAARRGFVNFSYISSYSAITRESRVFPEVEPWLFNDEKTGKPIYYTADRVAHYMASGLSPALQRAHAITISNLVREWGAHVVSLEQTSATWNSPGAFRGGKSGIDGIVELHRRIMAETPGAELAAEGMADLLIPFDRFHQVHVWQGIYEPSKQIAFPLLKRAHPISSALFHPWSRKIAFLDVTPPTGAFYWEDLKPALVRWGVLPSIRFDNTNLLRRLGTRAWFDEARTWQRVSGEPIFANRLGNPKPLVLKGANSSAWYEMDPDGNLDFKEEAGVVRTVFSLIRRRHEREIPPGGLPDWPALSADGTRAIALHPSNWYLADGGGKRPPLAAILTRAPVDAFIERHYVNGGNFAAFVAGAPGMAWTLEGKREGSVWVDGTSARNLTPGPESIAPASWLACLERSVAVPVLAASASIKALLFSSHGIMGRSGMIDPPASQVEKNELAQHPPCEFLGRKEEGLWLVPMNFGACRALLLFRTEQAGAIQIKPLLCLARELGLSGIAWNLRLDGKLLSSGRKKTSGWEDLVLDSIPTKPGLHAVEIEVDADGRWDGDMAFIGGHVALVR